MDVGDSLAKALGEANGGPLVRELFGDTRSDRSPFTKAASAIVGTVATFGTPTAVVLVRASSGIVVGFDLAGGGRIIVKVHRSHAAQRLPAVLRAQVVLRAAGLPVAEPLADAPIPLGTGWAVVETWHDSGASLDVRPPGRRRAVAVALRRIVEALDPRDFLDLRPGWAGPYPPPHSPIFDFAATGAGAEWIDEYNAAALAAKVGLAERSVGQLVVGHGDLRPENILVTRGSKPLVSAMYDLDSLVTDAEPWVVGGVARAFSTNWSLADPMLPEIDEIRAFISDYQAARGSPFTLDERELAHRGVQHALAYSARCEHALFPDESPAPWGSGWRDLLRLWVDQR